MVRALKLNTDREVVAAAFALILRCARVPGALVERDELNDLAVAADERVRRDTLLGHVLEKGVSLWVKVARKELFDAGGAKLPRRQADAVHDDEFCAHVS